MEHKNNLSGVLNHSIRDFLKNALTIMSKKPATVKFALQMIRSQRMSADRRVEHQKQGLQVPPFLIISITNKCNLNCLGCYAKAQHRSTNHELNSDNLRSVISEARDLGVSFIFLAGGEPLMRSDILDITNDFPDIIFPMFTNGLLISDRILSILKKQKHVIPVISMEGLECETDDRRGTGVYRQLEDVFFKMKKHGIFFGTSFTVTKLNFDTLTNMEFIHHLIEAGTELFFYVEYIPVRESTEHLVITDEQRSTLSSTLDSFRTKLHGLFVSFPGDEEAFGGCLSAGRGFIHISAEGNLEACPFAPYSDTNVKELSLKEALESRLLSKIRQNHAILTESKGGCALWENREWLKSLNEGDGEQ